MRAVLLLLLLVIPGCKGPEVPVAPASRHLTLHFLDQDGVLSLARPVRDGDWSFMDAGVWRPVVVTWRAEGLHGVGVIPRTAPQWVLLMDPDGEVHRIVMWEDAERPNPRLSGLRDEEREWLASLGLLWVLQWLRR